MAWIESHQGLSRHPKTRRAARALKVSVPTMMGHLHCLWHWALEFADDGDLTPYSSEEIADAALYEGDVDEFLDALVNCGIKGGHGFVERDEDTDTFCLHHWDDYAGKLVEKRRRDAERKKAARGSVSQDGGVPATSNGRPTDGSLDGAGNPTVPNLTVPNQKQEPSSSEIEEPREDVERLCSLLVDLCVSNGTRKKSVTKAWRTDARLLLDRDGIPLAEAERIMRWALADDFWKSNIQSIPKFREKFDMLKLRAASDRSEREHADRYHYD